MATENVDERVPTRRGATLSEGMRNDVIHPLEGDWEEWELSLKDLELTRSWAIP